MGTRIRGIIKQTALIGFTKGIQYLYEESDDAFINRLFDDACKTKRIPLDHLEDKKTKDVMLIGFCTAFEGTEISMRKQCKLFIELMEIDSDENGLNALHMQSVRLYGWKNRL